MLTYKDIIDAFTLKISKAFSSVDIFTDDTASNFDGKCFYVQLVPFPSSASNKEVNEKGFIASIKYYQEANANRLDLYEVLSELEKIFTRNVQVKDRYLNISSIEPNILNDEVGYYLDFAVTIRYFEEVYAEKIIYDPMNDIEIEYEYMSDIQTN